MVWHFVRHSAHCTWTQTKSVTESFVPVLFVGLVAEPKSGLVAVLPLAFLLEALSLHYPRKYATQSLSEVKLGGSPAPSQKLTSDQTSNVSGIRDPVVTTIANVVTTVLQKNENGISVSDASYENDAITQKTLKQPRWSKSTKKLQLTLQPRKNQMK